MDNTNSDVASAVSVLGLPGRLVIFGPRPSAVMDRWAVHLLAEIVGGGVAPVTEMVVRWVDGTGGLRIFAGGNLDVADGQLRPVAGAGAAVVPQPGGVAAPVGDDESHVALDVVSHCAEIAVGVGHALRLAVLSEGSGECGELAAALKEFDLGVEGQVCVDGVLAAGTVSAPFQLVVDVLLASAALVAVVIVAFVAWVIAFVRSGGPGELVSLHDIHLGAPVAVDLIGVAVTIAIGIHPDVTVLVFAWHSNSVESSDAAALVVAQIEVPLDGSAKEVWHEVVWSGLGESWCVMDVATAISGNGDIGGGAALGEGSGHVERLLLSIDLDLDLIKTGVSFLLQAKHLELLVVVRLGAGDEKCCD